MRIKKAPLSGAFVGTSRPNVWTWWSGRGFGFWTHLGSEVYIAAVEGRGLDPCSKLLGPIKALV
jgi:hypothetical protein